jgi:hypothetical protein
MPLKQYMILKRAVEIESIAQRRLNLYDFNRAFNDPKPLFQQLEKELMTLLHGKNKPLSNTVNWNKDPDWKSQLKKFQV